MTPLDLAFVLLSALLHAVWSVSIKSSADPLCFNLLQSWPVPLLLGAMLPFVDLAEVPRAVWELLLATGVAHSLYLYWMSRAYEHGDLSLVYPIARSTPAFLPLVALPLLGEVPSPLGALGIAIVVVGVWLVHGAQRWRLELLMQPAARFAFLTLAATVAYSLIDKAAMSGLAEAPWSSPVPRAIAYSLLLSTAHVLLFGPLVLRVRGLSALRATARSELPKATFATFISFGSYTLILKAMETALVSYVVAVRQSSVLFALVLGVWLLRERPQRERIVGATATVIGVALIALFP
ncbi:MAG: EamA family transporter [Myxococcota bacterium]